MFFFTQKKVLRALFLLLPFYFCIACQNVGFVDLARKHAEREFGIQMFIFGQQANGNFLTGAPTGFPSACFGLSGIDRANCYCQTIGAQLGRNLEFRAWLSISGVVDAICNIQGQINTTCTVPTNLGPFVIQKTNSTPLMAWDYEELSTTGSRVALRESPPSLIWTGSNANGRATGSDCFGWTNLSTNTGTVGETTIVGTAFTNIGAPATCDQVGTILCVQRPR